METFSHILKIFKRPVLHHQHDDMFEVVQSGWRHSPPTAVEDSNDSLRVVTLMTSAFPGFGIISRGITSLFAI